MRPTSSRALVEHVATAVEVYRIDHGRYPASLSDIRRDGGASAEIRDGWGHELVYRPDRARDTYELLSLGSDGKRGGTGRAADISNRDSSN